MKRISEQLLLLPVWAVVLTLSIPVDSHAHRLDEYLQAARISVEQKRIVVEVSLTPGAEVAADVLSSLDTNHDGHLSSEEADEYAKAFVEKLLLDVDGQQLALHLNDFLAPSPQEIRAGEGALRLRASAEISPIQPGTHRLHFANVHRSDIGVYLVNVLVPEDTRIHITGQSRDVLQHEFAMDYRMDSGLDRAVVLPSLVGFGVAGLLFTISRRLNEKSHATIRRHTTS